MQVHKFQFWLLSHKLHKKNQHISHGSLIFFSSVIKNLEGWRGKIFLYYILLLCKNIVSQLNQFKFQNVTAVRADLQISLNKFHLRRL